LTDRQWQKVKKALETENAFVTARLMEGDPPERWLCIEHHQPGGHPPISEPFFCITPPELIEHET